MVYFSIHGFGRIEVGWAGGQWSVWGNKSFLKVSVFIHFVYVLFRAELERVL